MLKKYVTCIALILLMTVPARALLSDSEREYQIKAGFLYNFTKFVNWPQPYSLTTQKEINICIVGDNPFSGASETLFKQASNSNTRFNLLGNDAWKTKFCHIVFVSQSKAGSIDSIFAALNSKPALTVGEVPGFAKKGGVMEFANDDNKVRLIINVQSASALGLKIDAQLLEIAKAVVGTSSL